MSTNEPTIQKRWYAIRTYSGHEARVKQLLESEVDRLGLQEYVPTVLIPLEKVFEVRDGKKRTRQKNFLPGYVLVEAVLNKKVRDLIQNTPSVINFVGTKTEPVPLQAEEIGKILDILVKRSATPGANKTPMTEITDEDIDNLFAD